VLGRHVRAVRLVDDKKAWNNIFGADVDGSSDSNTNLIYLALQGLQDPRSTLRHEAIHALKNLNVFNKATSIATFSLASVYWPWPMASSPTPWYWTPPSPWVTLAA
jgi:hypothetical protein